MGMAKKKSAKKPSAKNPWPETLLELRERWSEAPNKRLPQSEAAARIGVSTRSWNGWETGAQVPAKPVQILLDLLLEQARQE